MSEKTVNHTSNEYYLAERRKQKYLKQKLNDVITLKSITQVLDFQKIILLLIFQHLD